MPVPKSLYVLIKKSRALRVISFSDSKNFLGIVKRLALNILTSWTNE